jgi:hypothetical protein
VLAGQRGAKVELDLTANTCIGRNSNIATAVARREVQAVRANATVLAVITVTQSSAVIDVCAGKSVSFVAREAFAGRSADTGVDEALGELAACV